MIIHSSHFYTKYFASWTTSTGSFRTIQKQESMPPFF